MLVSRSRLLVAGSCLYPRPGIAAFDAVSGRFDSGWDARLRAIGDAGAFNVLRRLDGIVYAACAFHVAGAKRNGLAASRS
jgi:hypothetical protein